MDDLSAKAKAEIKSVQVKPGTEGLEVEAKLRFNDADVEQMANLLRVWHDSGAEVSVEFTPVHVQLRLAMEAAKAGK